MSLKIRRLIGTKRKKLTFRLLTGFDVDDCKQEVKSEPKLGHDICQADQPHLLTKKKQTEIRKKRTEIRKKRSSTTPTGIIG